MLFYGKYVKKKMWVDTVGYDTQIRVNCDRFKNIISHITSQHVSIEMVTNLMLVVCLLKHVLVSMRVPRLFECTTDGDVLNRHFRCICCHISRSLGELNRKPLLFRKTEIFQSHICHSAWLLHQRGLDQPELPRLILN